MNTEMPESAIRRAVRNCGSQQKLAEAIGVTQGRVSQWINGAIIHQRHYEAIERASKVPVADLLADDLARIRSESAQTC